MDDEAFRRYLDSLPPVDYVDYSVSDNPFDDRMGEIPMVRKM